MNVKLSNMCMIVDHNKVLFQNRTKKDWPGITLPGGKVEKDESIYDSCIREVKEETGLLVSNLVLSGIIHYELIDKDERWVIFLYKTDHFEGILKPNDNEDSVFWLEEKDIDSNDLSNDLDVYLKVYHDDNIMEAHAYWNGFTSSSFTFY